MKKYYFELDRKQLEKPTEPLYLFCAPARAWAVAETEEEARAAAMEKLNAKYHGTGMYLGKDLRLVKSAELPADWNYGYGSERAGGSADDRAALRQACTK